ncbi:acetyl-CoA carboxylase carboxyltransferase subunit alpha [Clostridium botulinum]|uniref:Acetyl-coenzyme A carboxylase carboxyl transferase subunit alpha n=1 Tax=Clostridium botulinum (strain Okra / Type B1) TaxID=498213 RepID=B1IH47_CLOBK|nr:acetyl-CoA carboxylase carboxyltransferase subunit alpha [Clostridium botulinum]EKX80154.1 acetyl-CoA carboxylase, carboxyl transferase subunit alpha [Clostridium botulinum CFSAN001628]ACA44171.1 acetyl-CoA carboxylase, carboxyl transferase, alpha subunit [Clostridium botulinum B1 str. Okra]MBD5563190.1 acetyl-CoA carboxylase carboxyltransferase subunit alpha [Clostridium botulinum]MBD5568161.1 acetyl-CoA carboxylase carboxyltransferase subunit alpha [Clostridium botulinum]MBD5571891.1 acet
MEDKKLIHNVKKYASKNAWQRVTLARLKERPTALDYINIIFDDFIELHGDRSFSDDQSIVCGIGLLDNKSVTVIAQQKGKNIRDNIKRNFGMPKPEGYRKALRIMKQAEKFKRPVVCFIDTPGAFCGIDAEERGQGEAIARNLLEMSRLKTITLSIVIGEGGSGGALALGVADRVIMLENSIYSILSPEGFASILWKDASKAKEAAEVMKITAEDLKGFNIIDKIIKEPTGGAHKNLNKMAETIKENIINEIEILKEYPLDVLLDKRYNKFRNMGVFSE